MIKQHIHRFVDWMESGPAFLTVWFIPILLIIGAYALIKNNLFPRKDNTQ